MRFAGFRSRWMMAPAFLACMYASPRATSIAICSAWQAVGRRKGTHTLSLLHAPTLAIPWAMITRSIRGIAESQAGPVRPSPMCTGSPYSSPI